MTPYRVSLACSAFVDDLKRLGKKQPQLNDKVRKKLEHILLNPAQLGDRLQAAPLCFKTRVGSDFRLIYMLQDFTVIPMLLYAKNEHSDVEIRKLLQAIEMVTRRAAGDR